MVSELLIWLLLNYLVFINFWYRSPLLLHFTSTMKYSRTICMRVYIGEPRAASHWNGHTYRTRMFYLLQTGEKPENIFRAWMSILFFDLFLCCCSSLWMQNLWYRKLKMLINDDIQHSKMSDIDLLSHDKSLVLQVMRSIGSGTALCMAVVCCDWLVPIGLPTPPSLIRSSFPLSLGYFARLRD